MTLHPIPLNFLLYEANFILFLSMYFNPHCIICRPSLDFTVSEDAGIESGTVATWLSDAQNLFPLGKGQATYRAQKKCECLERKEL